MRTLFYQMAVALRSQGFDARFCSLLLLPLLAVVLSSPSDSLAQKKRKRVLKGHPGSAHTRSLQTSLDLMTTQTYSLEFSESAHNILESSADSDLYDPLTMRNLTRLRELAQPPWNPDDLDPVRTRRVAEKALAIQAGQNLSRIAKQGELRDMYRSLKRSFQSFREAFRYSVQDSGNSYTVTKKTEGEKLLELQLEFNAKQGVDPQIRIGDAIRFRYDYIEGRPMLEYGIDF